MRNRLSPSQVDGMDGERFPILDVMRETRRLVYPIDADDQPLLDFLSAEITAAANNKLSNSLVELRRQCSEPLWRIDPNRANLATRFVADARLQRFRRLAAQSSWVDHQQSGRRILQLDASQVPSGSQYRGEGGPGYLQTAFPYLVLLLNFTHEARRNPELHLDEMIDRLSLQRHFTTSPTYHIDVIKPEPLDGPTEGSTLTGP